MDPTSYMAAHNYTSKRAVKREFKRYNSSYDREISAPYMDFHGYTPIDISIFKEISLTSRTILFG